MNLTTWAIKWHVPHAALLELRALAGVGGEYEPERFTNPRSEAAVQADLRVEASEKGGRLWRNNVGALLDARGVPVRFGIANDTPKMNKLIKSSDLIGIWPIVIEPEHVGQTIGQFWSVEVKEEGWRFTGTPHEAAQLQWINLVLSLGGRARFACERGVL